MSSISGSIWTERLYLANIHFHILEKTRNYWLLGHKSKLSTSNKFLIYKAILKQIWTYGIQLSGTGTISNKKKNRILNTWWWMHAGSCRTQSSKGIPRYQRIKMKPTATSLNTALVPVHTQMTQWQSHSTPWEQQANAKTPNYLYTRFLV
jgi:hypothetical protein